MLSQRSEIWRIAGPPDRGSWTFKHSMACNWYLILLHSSLFQFVIGMRAGHYANKDWKHHNGVSRPRLLRPRDVTKDQTYYLSSIPERSLSRALFPLGSITKTEVRDLAVKWNLPTAARQESMGICFVGEKRKFHDFICELRHRA